MKFDWWNLLPAWAQRLLARIPSGIVEFFSGGLALAAGVGLTSLVALGGGLSVRGAHVIAYGAATWFSAVYEIFVDPAGGRTPLPGHSETRDLFQRQVGITAWALLIWWVL